jgi:hypothetical protein
MYKAPSGPFSTPKGRSREIPAALPPLSGMIAGQGLDAILRVKIRSKAGIPARMETFFWAPVKLEAIARPGDQRSLGARVRVLGDLIGPANAGGKSARDQASDGLSAQPELKQVGPNEESGGMRRLLVMLASWTRLPIGWSFSSGLCSTTGLRYPGQSEPRCWVQDWR